MGGNQVLGEEASPKHPLHSSREYKAGLCAQKGEGTVPSHRDFLLVTETSRPAMGSTACF